MAQVVAGPAYRARRNTLSSVIDWVTDTDAHWQTGITWEDVLANGQFGVIGDTCSDDPPGLPKRIQRGDRWVDGTPFTIYASAECSAGGGFVSRAQEIANARQSALLDRGLHFALQSWWMEPRYGQTVGGSIGGTAIDAYASAEDIFWGAYPGAGVLITDPSALDKLDNVLTSEAGGLITFTGHRVALVPGLGKTLYIVPPITGYRSEVFTSSQRAGDLFNRGKNDMIAIAEQTFVLASDFEVGAQGEWS